MGENLNITFEGLRNTMKKHIRTHVVDSRFEAFKDDSNARLQFIRKTFFFFRVSCWFQVGPFLWHLGIQRDPGGYNLAEYFEQRSWWFGIGCHRGLPRFSSFFFGFGGGSSHSCGDFFLLSHQKLHGLIAGPWLILTRKEKTKIQFEVCISGMRKGSLGQKRTSWVHIRYLMIGCDGAWADAKETCLRKRFIRHVDVQVSFGINNTKKHTIFVAGWILYNSLCLYIYIVHVFLIASIRLVGFCFWNCAMKNPISTMGLHIYRCFSCLTFPHLLVGWDPRKWWICVLHTYSFRHFTENSFAKIRLLIFFDLQISSSP